MKKKKMADYHFVQIKVSNSDWAKAKRRATKDGINHVSAVLRMALAEYIREDGK